MGRVWNTSALQPDPQMGMLHAYMFDRQAVEFAALPANDRVNHCVRKVSEFLPHLPSELAASYVKVWSEDPWQLGAFAYPKPGEFHRMWPAARRAEGRVHFGGGTLQCGSASEGAWIANAARARSSARLGKVRLYASSKGLGRFDQRLEKMWEIFVCRVTVNASPTAADSPSSAAPSSKVVRFSHTIRKDTLLPSSALPRGQVARDRSDDHEHRTISPGRSQPPAQLMQTEFRSIWDESRAGTQGASDNPAQCHGVAGCRRQDSEGRQAEARCLHHVFVDPGRDARWLARHLRAITRTSARTPRVKHAKNDASVDIAHARRER